MGRKTSAVLSHISDVVATATSTCTSVAFNSAKIDLQGKGDVSLTDVVIDSSAGSNLTDAACDSSTDAGNVLDGGADKLKDALAERLDKVMLAASASLRGRVTSLKAKLVDTVTASASLSCFAHAINNVAIRFQHVQKDINIRDVHVKQVAIANIHRCVTNLKVVQTGCGADGGEACTPTTLATLLEEAEDIFKADQREDLLKNPFNAAALTRPPPTPAAKKPCRVPSQKELDDAREHNTILIGVGAGLLLIVMAAIVLTHKRRPATGPSAK